jgi:hypothetical protein
MLPILLVSALILGPLAMGNDVFATLTPPNAPNTGGGSNTANQDTTATTTSSPATGTLQVVLNNPNSISATYAVTVTGNNPQPSSFSLSAISPQFVKLGPGSFAVSVDTSASHSFSGDCIGTISDGQMLSCTIQITAPQ